MTEVVSMLKEAIYDDCVPPVCVAELFGMDSEDDQLNSMVMGVWQGAVKYHNELKLEHIKEALFENKVRDLFCKATQRLAKRGHPYSLRLLDKLDSVVFECPVPYCGIPCEDALAAEDL